MYGKEKTQINANWIWHPIDNNPVNQWVIFRKKIYIKENIIKASMIVTADARYWAYINGTFICRGPAKGFSHEYFYDEIDITYDIQNGDNVFCFTAHHIGVNIHQHILGEPGFLCQIVLQYANGETERIISDDTFKTKLHTGFMQDSFRISCGQGYSEIYNASQADLEIHKSDYKDSNWENAKVRYSYENSFWGKLQIKETHPFTYDEVYPKTVLYNNSVKSNGVSVVFDYNHRFLHPKDLEINSFLKPAWFYAFFEIKSEEDMKINLTFCHSRLWCSYGKFSINGKTYLEEMDKFKIDPRQTGPVTVEIDLSRGSNYFVMDCSGDSMGKQFPLYFDTNGKKLEFFSPLTGEEGSAFCSSHLKDLSIGEKDELCPLIWDYLISKDFDRLNEITDSIDSTHVSFASPQIPSIHREVIKPNDIKELLPAIHYNNSFCEIKPDGFDREITFDMGEEVAGMIEFEIIAPEGVVLDFYGVEYMDMYGKRQEMDGVCNGMRYITSKGKQKYTSHLPRGFRYLIMSIRNFQEIVRLKYLRVLSSTHPVAQTGDFLCSDYKINKIWEISKRTSILCMFDTSVDCPGHEQSFWTGDFRNEALIGHYLFGAYEHTDHCLKVGMGSLKTAPLPMASVPSVPQGVMPTWALLYMLVYYELYLYSGDRDILQKHYERFVILIENCLKMTDETKLFKPPYNDMLDWSHIDLRANAYNSHSNALLYKNLKQISYCAKELGKEDEAEKYETKAEIIKEAINRLLWVKDKNAFADCLTPEGEYSNHFSIQVQSVMVMTGCADKSNESVLKNYFENGFPEDFQRIGSPFASMFYHEALSRLGLVQVILEDIRKGWGIMTDLGSTTCFETFPGWEIKDLTRSHCHAWSACPAYVTGHDILGVIPIEPGFKKVTIRPNLGDLNWAKGRVPVPGGYISIDIMKEENGKTKVKAIVPGWIEIKTVSDFEYEISKI